MNLYEKLQTVNNKDSFIEFLKALSKDSNENKHAWENMTIEDYLESIAAWTEDSGDTLNKGFDSFENKEKILFYFNNDLNISEASKYLIKEHYNKKLKNRKFY